MTHIHQFQKNKPIRRPNYVARYRCYHCSMITQVQNEIGKDDKLQCLCGRWLTRLDRIWQHNSIDRFRT